VPAKKKIRTRTAQKLNKLAKGTKCCYHPSATL
jgi:hypothetical protein